MIDISDRPFILTFGQCARSSQFYPWTAKKVAEKNGFLQSKIWQKFPLQHEHLNYPMLIRIFAPIGFWNPKPLYTFVDPLTAFDGKVSSESMWKRFVHSPRKWTFVNDKTIILQKANKKNSRNMKEQLVNCHNPMRSLTFQLWTEF